MQQPRGRYPCERLTAGLEKRRKSRWKRGSAARHGQRGWRGSIDLLEIGRGPGGRAATRTSRQDDGLRINHGAPLFNIRAQTPPELMKALAQRGVIRPFSGSIQSLDAQRSLGPAIADGFSDGTQSVRQDRRLSTRGEREQINPGPLICGQGARQRRV